jgi:NAD(P)-dependent dehydrogenase (short-subunit alcohol dehydrogenase family)
MASKTVVITGGNTGLGYQCAKRVAIAGSDHHVVLACRSRTRGEAAAEALRAETGNPNITTLELDLASLASVRTFADALADAVADASLPPLYAVVCNAGLSAAGMPGTPRTDDGVETIFGVNHLGHFLLANPLVDQMDSGGRIVFVTSDLHDPPAFFPVRVRYEGASAIANGRPGMRQYALSKLCNLYCTYEMARRVAERTDRHITVNAFNPGAMTDTGFAAPSGNAITRHATRLVGGVMGKLIGKQGTSTESGAALARLVIDHAYDGVNGKYFDRGVETPSSTLSYDLDNARELWEVSAQLCELDEPAQPS